MIFIASRGAGQDMDGTPRVYRRDGKGDVIYYALQQTRLGLMLVAASDRGLCCAAFGEGEATLLEQLQAAFSQADIRPSTIEASEHLNNWATAIAAYLARQTPLPNLPLDLRGTAFQMMVWRYLLHIEAGNTLSYRELAEAVNKPKAARAVASACGANKVAILVPCHRILQGDGGLGGYRWGLERKRDLLELEKSESAHWG